MKKITYLVAFLIIAIGFLGCATSSNVVQETGQEAEQEGRHYERAGGFSIMIPDAWEVHEMPGLKYKVLAGQTENNFTANITFADEEFDGSLDEYVDATIAQLKNLFGDNIEILQRGEFVTSKNLRGERVAVNTMQYGRYYRQIFYCFPGNGVTMIAACTATAESGEAFANMFDRTMQTFEWTQ